MVISGFFGNSGFKFIPQILPTFFYIMVFFMTNNSSQIRFNINFNIIIYNFSIIFP